MLVALRHLVFGLLLTSAALAAPFDNQFMHVGIPADFDGPVVTQPERAVTVSTFSKRHPNDAHSTLIEITTRDGSSQLSSMSAEQRVAATDYYLGQFLDGVAAKQTTFNAAPLDHGTIGGIMTSRTTWSGTAQGLRVSGVVYCVIAYSEVVVFDTQDFDDAPAENRFAAVQAIESATFKRR